MIGATGRVGSEIVRGLLARGDAVRADPVQCLGKVAAERQFLDRLTGAGIPAGTAELLLTREWAILADENDYTTGTFEQITGRPRARWPSSFTSTARNSPDAHTSPSPDPRGPEARRPAPMPGVR